MDGLNIALGLDALLPEALLGCEPTAFDGFGFSLGLEGNYVPFEANLTNDLMRLHERFCNLLKMNRFHGCLCGEPHESSRNSYNGKIRNLCHRIQSHRYGGFEESFVPRH